MERDADYFPLLGRSGLGDSQEYQSVPNVSAENFLILFFLISLMVPVYPALSKALRHPLFKSV
jgi:hypothetical protein